MHRVDPERLDLAREFKMNPTGPHSPDLQKVLKLLRWGTLSNRFLVVRPRHEGPWFLARTTGPKGHPIEIFRSRGIATQAEAHWALFRQRWQQQTGQALVLDEEDRLDPVQDGGELSQTLSSKPLLGYTDPFCVEAGQTIQFKVSSELPGEYQAEIVRLRCADHLDIGLKQSTVTTPVNGLYTGRFQPTQAGSYVEVAA